MGESHSGVVSSCHYGIGRWREVEAGRLDFSAVDRVLWF